VTETTFQRRDAPTALAPRRMIPCAITVAIRVITMPIYVITSAIPVITMPIPVITMPIPVITMRRSR
jgi:hypothetical protein